MPRTKKTLGSSGETYGKESLKTSRRRSICRTGTPGGERRRRPGRVLKLEIMTGYGLGNGTGIEHEI